MHKEIVERRRWLGEGRFLHALNYCMMLPGPEATQLAIYVGWLLHRTAGGIVAGVLFVAPSILVLLALSYVYAAHGTTAFVSGLLSGFKPVVVAIVVEAVLRIGGRALKGRAHFLIAASAFAGIYFLRVPFPVIVLLAALVGLVGARLRPEAFGAQVKAESDAEAESKKDAAEGRTPRVIEDDQPPPAHTLPSTARALKVLLVGLVLWLAPFVPVAAWLGTTGLHAQEYFFFTKAALVTFGGAYAVLAYVTQAVTVAPFNWLAPAQAVDGLALAETTPGPLIMVLQFVGFMAAWNHPPAGLSPLASAVLGSLLTTYATFLPCFVFIFLGAPYVEVVRNRRGLAGALAGVTAAVVGVILNLALVFGAAVILPRGLGGGPDLFALALTALAFVALYRLKIEVLWVVLAGGLLGLARGLLFN
jgi:chromate transporter